MTVKDVKGGLTVNDKGDSSATMTVNGASRLSEEQRRLMPLEPETTLKEALLPGAHRRADPSVFERW